MAKTKVRRISANENTVSSVAAQTTGPAWAVWILSRFPGVRYRYQSWGTTKRVIIAILLYLVALPIIPILVAAVWYAKDPEGFKKSPLMPVLIAVIAAWLQQQLKPLRTRSLPRQRAMPPTVANLRIVQQLLKLVSSISLAITRATSESLIATTTVSPAKSNLDYRGLTRYDKEQ